MLVALWSLQLSLSLAIVGITPCDQIICYPLPWIVMTVAITNMLLHIGWFMLMRCIVNTHTPSHWHKEVNNSSKCWWYTWSTFWWIVNFLVSFRRDKCAVYFMISHRKVIHKKLTSWTEHYELSTNYFTTCFAQVFLWNECKNLKTL